SCLSLPVSGLICTLTTSLTTRAGTRAGKSGCLLTQAAGCQPQLIHVSGASVMANESHPTQNRAESKPAVVSGNHKPYPEFPFTDHPTGRWCKKIKTPHGWKIFYFGPLADWKAALQRYKDEIDDLRTGRTPTARVKEGLRLIDLANHFLHFKRGLVATGELTM